jgi:hypothetical protein
VTDRSPTSTLPDASFSLTRRRAGYLVTTVLLTLLMAAAVLDATRPTAILGVHSEVARDQRGGLQLAVTYADVSRPALATPFDIQVQRRGGFGGPVRIAIDPEYLRMWDENGLSPAPATETVMGRWLVWEFDPPIGDTLFVTLDGRIEPAAQDGRSGVIAVLSPDDEILAEVSFTTRVLP